MVLENITKIENIHISEEHPTLIVFGNPILDVTCKLETNDVLTKYNLIADHQYEKSSEEIQKMKADALQASGGMSSTNPGGSSLNTARIFGLLVPPERKIMFCGSIGNDENGALLTKLLKRTTVKAIFEISCKEPTGSCLCMIWKENSCLVADIGAALHYNIKQVKEDPLNGFLRNTKFIYMEAYFIPNRFPTCEYLVKEICEKHGAMFILNLSAKYICETFQKECKLLSESADIVFGKLEQFLGMGKAYKTDDLKTIMCNMLKNHRVKQKKFEGFKKKLLVVTNGSEPVVIFYLNGDELCQETYTVPKLPTKDLVDTTGAGDSFVSGFMAAYIKNATPLKCVEYGVKVSFDVVKNIGCNLSADFPRALEQN